MQKPRGLVPTFCCSVRIETRGTAKVLNIAKPPVVLTQLAIQRSAMHGIRLEAPTRFRTRVSEVPAPNWR